MTNEHENPQSPQHGQQDNPQPGHRSDQERPMSPEKKGQTPGERQRDDDRGLKPGQPGHDNDDDKVGQDTDGDGKVVKPGQKPGQSGGRGLPENR